MAKSGGNLNISTRITLDGDEEYKASVKDINTGIKLLKSNMEATQSAFGDNTDSAEALTAKLENLKKQYDLQKQAVELATDRLEKGKAEYGANSAEANALQLALDKATIAMNKTGAEIDATSGALDKLQAGSEETTDSQDELSKSVKDAGDRAQDAGKKTIMLKDALTGVADLAKNGLSNYMSAVGLALSSIASAALDATGAAYGFAKGAGTMADNVATL